MILKRRKRPKMGVRKESRIRCKEHLQWVRGHACAIQGINGHVCSDKMQAAHVRTGTDGALNIKPSDCWTIPLCSKAHIPIQHAIGERAFELRYGIDMHSLAMRLWAASPYRYRYEQKQRPA